MANNNEQFRAFHDVINATQDKRKTLKKNREALRTRIKKYFKENLPCEIQPKFHWQGSYAMHTILNPIKDEETGLGVYDLDDGVYFVGQSQNERKSLEWYHYNLKKAVEGHTSQDPVDKSACIRVEYADGHHVDLPMYFMVDGDEHPQLAHRKNPWVLQDPRDLIDWFSDECGEKPMLRHLVRYLKAWADYVNNTKDFEMPCGCIMTMLGAEYYQDNDDNREDVAMKDLLVNMYDNLSQEGGFKCIRPVSPGDDLFEHYSETRKNKFLSELKSFKEDAERAINCKNPHDACMKWQKHFGTRFCCSTAKDEDEDAQKQNSTGFIKSNSQFA